MTRAFLFLLACSLKNRVSLRLKKLRRPQYMISLLAGLAYIYFVFLHPFHPDGSRQPPAGFAPDPTFFRTAEPAFASLLLGAVVFQWLLPGARRALFSEAEIQMLFPAPIPRQALLHYHMAKAQFAILFGTCITALIAGTGTLVQSPGYFFVGLWIVYTFLYLCRVAGFMARRALRNLGLAEWKLRAGMLGFLLFAATVTAVWSQWFLPAPGQAATPASAEGMSWFLQITGSGPAYLLLLPFRWVVRPALASAPAQFALSLLPAIAFLASVYGCIRLSRVHLDETFPSDAPVLPRPGAKTAHAADLRVHRRPPFRLAPGGAPPTALYWKNLILAGRFRFRRIIAILAGVFAMLAAVKMLFDGNASAILGSVAAALAGFFALLGPIVFREDLRTDWRNLDILKTYPIPGWGIVLGEVLAPATVLMFLECVFLSVALWLLPGAGSIPWGFADRICIGLAAVLFLPSVSLIGVLVQNATVLILPGWVHLGREHQQGIEAMGQRLISSIATALCLLVFALPAMIFSAGIFFAGYRAVGMPILIPAAAAAAGTLLLEAGVCILWLGRLFDRYDAAYE